MDASGRDFGELAPLLRFPATRFGTTGSDTSICCGKTAARRMESLVRDLTYPALPLVNSTWPNQSSPFFFRISGAFALVISIVGKVMTGSSFSPLSSFAACLNPSAPGVA